MRTWIVVHQQRSNRGLRSLVLGTIVLAAVAASFALDAKPRTADPDGLVQQLRAL
jgi:hypothetical protein